MWVLAWVACARGPVQAEVDVWVPPLGVEVDLDQDGIVDDDELWLGTFYDDEDTDGDGVFDGDELLLGIDPTNVDTDGDAVIDGDELLIGLDPTDVDSDAGGAWDGDELLFGTSPDDPGDDLLAVVPGAFVGGGGCDHTSTTPPGLPAALLVCVVPLLAAGRSRRWARGGAR